MLRYFTVTAHVHAFTHNKWKVKCRGFVEG